jgi:hypothetical protein
VYDTPLTLTTSLFAFGHRRIREAEAQAELLALERKRLIDQEAFARELEIAQRKEREKVFKEKKVQREQRKEGGEGMGGGRGVGPAGGGGGHHNRGRHHKPKPPSEGAAVKFDPKSMGIVGMGTGR